MLKLKTKTFKTAIASATAISMLMISGCTTVPASYGAISKEARISKVTKTQEALQALSAPNAKVTVAVYEFEDKTGQFKPTEAGQTLSRAVSQGGDELLIKALQDAGNRSWFTIIERSNLNNLLKERQIITEMRSRYLGEKTVNSKALPPLLFAGVIFEGAIVGFDANTVTGGAAARYLGIGGQTDYRQNVVTVHLRAVSVKTGEVLASVTTEKTIASVGVAANAFRFVTFDNLLEADIGVTSNEPGLLALRQAIEKSVYAIVMEGSEIGLWNFQDRTAGMALLREYKYERDGRYPAHVSLAQTSGQSKTALNQLAQPTPAARNQAVRKMAAAKPVAQSKAAVTKSAPIKASKAYSAPVQTARIIPAAPVEASPVKIAKTYQAPAQTAAATPNTKTFAVPVTPVQVKPMPAPVAAKSQQTASLSAVHPAYQQFTAPVSAKKATSVRQSVTSPVIVTPQVSSKHVSITEFEVELDTLPVIKSQYSVPTTSPEATVSGAADARARALTLSKQLRTLSGAAQNTGTS